jgi:RHS repeat-associated protein
VKVRGTCSPVFWYYHGDHLGSTNVITDRSGSMVWHYENYAFGKERYNNAACTFSISNPYTGQIFDDDTGLYYYNARYGACPERGRRDPELGRFIQADTIVPSAANPHSLNRYSY